MPKKTGSIYKELAKIRMVGVIPPEHPLAQKLELDAADFETEKLILLEPQRCPDYWNAVQHELAQGKTVSNLLLCNSFEACIVLAKAGFGMAMLPDIPDLRDPALAYVPIRGVEPLSYGVYYKSAAGKPQLKQFIQLCRDAFSAQNTD